ncbi:MAG TPA: molecular chaperone TorD family protein [Dehalococcoidales bacterium]|nr:MAG: hypothetical protein A2Z05_02890 [Chloroflexi bacterium RBG_16_60_22]HJX12631.1 molecular chaperone TorD family protein [Dehalococcoidales bacterium]
MIFPEETGQLCRLFADVLDYPGAALVTSAEDCAAGLKASHNGAAEAMQSFADFARSQPPGAMEELYTQTFDVTPANTLYIGYHTFGETPRRSVFLVRLQEAYQSHGFSGGTELADHLSVLLRFLSVARDREFAAPLVRDCILPVLEKMEKSFPKDRPGYGPAVGSLRRFLGQIDRKLIKSGGLAHD